MAKLIWVQPGKDDGRVALFETHADHPNGEAWVAVTGQAVQVALTPMVERKLKSGDLVEVDASKAISKEAPKRKTKAEIEAELAAAGNPAAAAAVLRKATEAEADKAGLTEEEAKTATVAVKPVGSKPAEKK